MKTLYISDLDGTLLNSDAQISQYTADTLNSLISYLIRINVTVRVYYGIIHLNHLFQN